MLRKIVIVVLTALALLSLLAWPMSYRWPVAVRYFRDGLSPRFCIGTPYSVVQSRMATRPVLGMATSRGAMNLVGGQEVKLLLDPQRVPPRIALLGMEIVGHGDFPNRWDPWTARVPVGLFATAFAAYPVLSLARSSVVRRRQRRKLGLCMKCGYSLRGNLSGCCPECGTPATAAT